MKKRIVFIMSVVLLLTVALAACSQTANTDDTATASADEQAETPSAEVQTSEDAELSGDAEASADVADTETSDEAQDDGGSLAQMNANGLVFGGSEDAFFSAYESTDEALDALEPLLYSAVWATMDVEDLFYVEDYPVDAAFEWTTVYHLINDYEYDRDGVSWDDGNIVVQEYSMESFFKDTFGSYTIPEIDGVHEALISYDDAGEQYTLVSADGGGMAFVLKSIALSLTSSAADGSQSATLQFDITLNDGTVESTLAVEIIPSAESSYQYTIQAAYPVEYYTVVNPMTEATEQDIMEALGVSFDIPDRAGDIRYFIIDSGDTSMAQADFTLDGSEITYRIQPSSAFSDISGVYEDWTNTESIEVSYCTGEAYGNDNQEGLCLWYDAAPGLMYSLYMNNVADLDTLTAVAGELFVPMQGDA